MQKYLFITLQGKNFIRGKNDNNKSTFFEASAEKNLYYCGVCVNFCTYFVYIELMGHWGGGDHGDVFSRKRIFFGKASVPS